MQMPCRKINSAWQLPDHSSYSDVYWITGAPGRIRTSDPQIRSLVLWAYTEFIGSLVIELRERRRRGRRHFVRYISLKIASDRADKSGLIWSGCEQTGHHEKVFTKTACMQRNGISCPALLSPMVSVRVRVLRLLRGMRASSR